MAKEPVLLEIWGINLSGGAVNGDGGEYLTTEGSKNASGGLKHRTSNVSFTKTRVRVFAGVNESEAELFNMPK